MAAENKSNTFGPKVNPIWSSNAVSMRNNSITSGLLSTFLKKLLLK